MKTWLKRTLFAQGRGLRRLRGGLGRDQLMMIDLQTQLQRYLGLDERELSRDLSKLVSSCRTLVDVGANDGFYTIAFLASPAEKVIACEPGLVAERLLANAAANGHTVSSRFQLVKRLIGNAAGEASLRAILEGSPRPIFIKVDVDGSEESVVRSIEGYPYLSEVSWVVETHSLGLERVCFEWFASRRYKALIVKSAWWRSFLPEQRPIRHNRWLIATPSR